MEMASCLTFCSVAIFVQSQIAAASQQQLPMDTNEISIFLLPLPSSYNKHFFQYLHTEHLDWEKKKEMH